MNTRKTITIVISESTSQLLDACLATMPGNSRCGFLGAIAKASLEQWAKEHGVVGGEEKQENHKHD